MHALQNAAKRYEETAALGNRLDTRYQAIYPPEAPCQTMIMLPPKQQAASDRPSSDLDVSHAAKETPVEQPSGLKTHSVRNDDLADLGSSRTAVLGARQPATDVVATSLRHCVTTVTSLHAHGLDS